MPFADRFQAILDHKNVNPQQAASLMVKRIDSDADLDKVISFSRRIRKYIKGESLPNSEFLFLFFDTFPEYNTDWLINDRGNMILEEFLNKEDKQNHYYNSKYVSTKKLDATIQQLFDEIRQLKDEIKSLKQNR